MTKVLRRLFAPAMPGACALLILMVATYGLILLGPALGIGSLLPWLALSGEGCWHGRVWSLVTYALVPGSAMDFVFNSIMILVIGSYLERVWSRSQLWWLCLTSALVPGMVYALLNSSSPRLLVGATPVVFGLLAAWGWLCGHEKILFLFFWETTIKQAAIIMVAIAWLTMAFCPCIGLLNATLMLLGGIAGLAHVWLQERWLRSRPSRTVSSERIGRLEL